MVLHDDAKPTDPLDFQPRQLPEPCHAMATTSDSVPGERSPEFDRAIRVPRLLMQPSQDW
jgi:hypothetical protein